MWEIPVRQARTPPLPSSCCKIGSWSLRRAAPSPPLTLLHITLRRRRRRKYFPFPPSFSLLKGTPQQGCQAHKMEGKEEGRRQTRWKKCKFVTFLLQFLLIFFCRSVFFCTCWHLCSKNPIKKKNTSLESIKVVWEREIPAKSILSLSLSLSFLSLSLSLSLFLSLSLTHAAGVSGAMNGLGWCRIPAFPFIYFFFEEKKVGKHTRVCQFKKKITRFFLNLVRAPLHVPCFLFTHVKKKRTKIFKPCTPLHFPYFLFSLRDLQKIHVERPRKCRGQEGERRGRSHLKMLSLKVFSHPPRRRRRRRRKICTVLDALMWTLIATFLFPSLLWRNSEMERRRRRRRRRRRKKKSN